MPPPTEPQDNNVSATLRAPGGPGGEYGGYDGDSSGQQPPPDALGSSAAGDSMEPSDADPQLLSWFAAVDTVNSGWINARELERVLKNEDWTPFDMLKMLMSIFDTNRKGTIRFKQFTGLRKV
ncbi:hypothetical protein K435DRAFT_878253 [Dendrothele bispora CBS 962.96]|uniref:EF-hand domain-containing protein n=1 Tax=Dendrothele bispora (strain CBS 962.96) TaxID=1314807 RepID=A0A4S8KNB4_DENBC|nr:hypothetical protein K435DRAFT_878253 [Dendrothele bispora CBS 962.96]